MKCAPGRTSGNTRLANCSGGILAGSLANTGEPLRLRTGRTLGKIHRPGILSGDPLAGYSAGSTSGLLLGYSAGSSYAADELLWRDRATRDTRRDPVAGCSGAILGGIHWRAALVGYSLASSSDNTLAGIHWPAALLGYLAGFLGELLWDTERDTWRDQLASRSGGILGGIHWRAAPVGGLLDFMLESAFHPVSPASCRAGNPWGNLILRDPGETQVFSRQAQKALENYVVWRGWFSIRFGCWFGGAACFIEFDLVVWRGRLFHLAWIGGG